MAKVSFKLNRKKGKKNSFRKFSHFYNSALFQAPSMPKIRSRLKTKPLGRIDKNRLHIAGDDRRGRRFSHTAECVNQKPPQTPPPAHTPNDAATTATTPRITPQAMTVEDFRYDEECGKVSRLARQLHCLTLNRHKNGKFFALSTPITHGGGAHTAPPTPLPHIKRRNVTNGCRQRALLAVRRRRARNHSHHTSSPLFPVVRLPNNFDQHGSHLPKK